MRRLLQTFIAFLVPLFFLPASARAASSAAAPDSTFTTLGSPRFMQESLIRRPALYPYAREKFQLIDPVTEGQRWGLTLCLVGPLVTALGVAGFFGDFADAERRTFGIVGGVGIVMFGVGFLLLRHFVRNY